MAESGFSAAADERFGYIIVFKSKNKTELKTLILTPTERRGPAVFVVKHLQMDWCLVSLTVTVRGYATQLLRSVTLRGRAGKRVQIKKIPIPGNLKTQNDKISINVTVLSCYYCHIQSNDTPLQSSVMG